MSMLFYSFSVSITFIFTAQSAIMLC